MVNEPQLPFRPLVWRILLVLAIAWTLWASLMPTHALPGVSVWDKLAHAVNYALLTILLMSVVPRLPLWIVATIVSAFGGAIELVQSATGYRSGDWLDMLANLVGVSVSIGGMMLWRYFRERSV